MDSVRNLFLLFEGSRVPISAQKCHDEWMMKQFQKACNARTAHKISHMITQMSSMAFSFCHCAFQAVQHFSVFSVFSSPSDCDTTSLSSLQLVAILFSFYGSYDESKHGKLNFLLKIHAHALSGDNTVAARCGMGLPLGPMSHVSVTWDSLLHGTQSMQPVNIDALSGLFEPFRVIIISNHFEAFRIPYNLNSA